jgi:hypothetical protein
MAPPISNRTPVAWVDSWQSAQPLLCACRGPTAVARPRGGPGKYAGVMGTDTDGAAAAAAAAEETKRKFREALERKSQKTTQRAEAHLEGGSAIHGVHGASDNKREFRRKSG